MHRYLTTTKDTVQEKEKENNRAAIKEKGKPQHKGATSAANQAT